MKCASRSRVDRLPPRRRVFPTRWMRACSRAARPRPLVLWRLHGEMDVLVCAAIENSFGHALALTLAGELILFDLQPSIDHLVADIRPSGALVALPRLDVRRPHVTHQPGGMTCHRPTRWSARVTRSTARFVAERCASRWCSDSRRSPSAQPPWENAVNVLQTSFTGPIARGLSLVAIVIGGLTFAYGEGGSKRILAGIVFGVGMAIGAVNFMAWLFP